MQAFEIRLRPGRDRTCPVRVGVGVLDLLVQDLAGRPPGGTFVVVSDSRVAPLHGAPILRRLRERGLRAELLTFEPGEASKTRETKAALEDRLLDLGAGRDTVLLAVGGGVTGDLAGFLAATWHRGVPVFQVPTTLLSMADSALGGKTGVDLPGGKNLVGAFHQPRGLYADLSVLGTLPEPDYVAGFAEIVKSAAIADARLFRFLEDSVGRLRGRDLGVLEEVVTACLRIKARVVIRDERDAGHRAVLNFGHTVAHALEAASGFRQAHGPSVATGMVAESRIAVHRTGFPPAHAARIERLLGALGLPPTWPQGVSPDAVSSATRRDKKARAGLVRYALPRRLGRMLPGEEVTVPVDDSILLGVLRELAR